MHLTMGVFRPLQMGLRLQTIPRKGLIVGTEGRQLWYGHEHFTPANIRFESSPLFLHLSHLRLGLLLVLSGPRQFTLQLFHFLTMQWLKYNSIVWLVTRPHSRFDPSPWTNSSHAIVWLIKSYNKSNDISFHRNLGDRRESNFEHWLLFFKNLTSLRYSLQKTLL